MSKPVQIDILLDISDRDVQKVFREIDRDTLAKALKSVDESVKEKVFKNMSKRGAKMLQEDMGYMGPVRSKDVTEAQTKIIAIIRHLVDIGEIILKRVPESELL